MKCKNFCWVIFLALIPLWLLTACPSQPSGGGGGGNVSSASSSFTPIEALNFDFEDGNVPSSLYVAYGNVTEKTVVEIDGHKCLKISGQTSSSYAEPAHHSIEIQFDLKQAVDMNNEDFVISFDYYIPEDSFTNMGGFQFSFWKVPGYTPIYSGLYKEESNKWCSIAVPIDTNTITYSGFEENPADWKGINKIRFQFSPKSGTSEGLPVTFYLDNIVVTNRPK